MSTRHPPAALVSERAAEARHTGILKTLPWLPLAVIRQGKVQGYVMPEPVVYWLGHAVTDAVAANA